MKIHDYLAITCALLVALWADRTAARAYRAAVICTLVQAGGWVRAFEMRSMFGPGVYPVLRRLYDDKLIERGRRQGGAERSYYDDYLYRWIEPEGDEPDPAPGAQRPS